MAIVCQPLIEFHSQVYGASVERPGWAKVNTGPIQTARQSFGVLIGQYALSYFLTQGGCKFRRHKIRGHHRKSGRLPRTDKCLGLRSVILLDHCLYCYAGINYYHIPKGSGVALPGPRELTPLNQWNFCVPAKSRHSEQTALQRRIGGQTTRCPIPSRWPQRSIAPRTFPFGPKRF